MRTPTHAFLWVILALTALSCEEAPAAGEKGGACRFGEATCDGDLVCHEGKCVDADDAPASMPGEEDFLADIKLDKTELEPNGSDTLIMAFDLLDRETNEPAGVEGVYVRTHPLNGGHVKPGKVKLDAKGHGVVEVRACNVEYERCPPTFEIVLASLNAPTQVLGRSQAITNLGVTFQQPEAGGSDQAGGTGDGDGLGGTGGTDSGLGGSSAPIPSGRPSGCDTGCVRGNLHIDAPLPIPLPDGRTNFVVDVPVGVANNIFTFGCGLSGCGDGYMASMSPADMEGSTPPFAHVASARFEPSDPEALEREVVVQDIVVGAGIVARIPSPRQLTGDPTKADMPFDMQFVCLRYEMGGPVEPVSGDILADRFDLVGSMRTDKDGSSAQVSGTCATLVFPGSLDFLYPSPHDLIEYPTLFATLTFELEAWF